MTQARWDQRFFASTRGRIVALLRRAGHTVDELAGTLGLTDNAVRSHLATLERDGLVHQRGVRRGGGKPAFTYALTPEADALFPKAYGPVLNELLVALDQRLPPPELEALLRQIGRRLAAATPAPSGDLHTRLQAAASVLEALGGLADVEERDGHLWLRGYSCPLAAVVPQHPRVCVLGEALVSALAGVPVREQCDRSAAPRCCFEVVPDLPAAPADAPPTAPALTRPDDDDEPLGGEPPCWAHLLDDEGKLG